VDERGQQAQRGGLRATGRQGELREPGGLAAPDEWFRALERALGPVVDLVASTVYWVDPDWFVPALGAIELLVGVGLMVNLGLRLVLAVLSVMFPEHAPDVLRGWTHRFGRLFTQSIYKWVQAPLSLHVGNLDLDRERALQLPVVQKSEWQ